jgi:1-acyl-sn-glycerol-3-phosphate acyltransferase
MERARYSASASRAHEAYPHDGTRLSARGAKLCLAVRSEPLEEFEVQGRERAQDVELTTAEPPAPEAAAPEPASEQVPSDRKRKREKASILRFLHPEGVDWGAHIEDFDASAVASVKRIMDRFFGGERDRRYFRVRVDGWQHMPPAPAMIVSNHSGGTSVLDVWGLAYAWYTRFGTTRPFHPTAHEMVLGNRFTGAFFAKRGVVRADRKVARRVLAEWKEDLVVLPGGDIDVWRPHNARYEVRFAGRTGYARIALEAGVPIVPVAHAGAHDTLYVITDGRNVAKALRFPELARAHIFPVHISLPWGLTFGPWPHIPPPARLRYRFAEPVLPEHVGARPGHPPTDDQVAELDRLVRASVQRELHVLRDGG